jgi:hypothetical protein
MGEWKAPLNLRVWKDPREELEIWRRGWDSNPSGGLIRRNFRTPLFPRGRRVGAPYARGESQPCRLLQILYVVEASSSFLRLASWFGMGFGTNEYCCRCCKGRLSREQARPDVPRNIVSRFHGFKPYRARPSLMVTTGVFFSTKWFTVCSIIS